MTIRIEALAEVMAAGRAGFGGNLEGWTTQWVAQGPQEPERQVVAHSILQTERLAGCGGAQTGMLAAAIGMRVGQEIDAYPESKRMQYFAGLGKTCEYLTQSWRSSRVLPDETQAYPIWGGMLGNNPKVRQVVQSAIKN